MLKRCQGFDGTIEVASKRDSFFIINIIREKSFFSFSSLLARFIASVAQVRGSGGAHFDVKSLAANFAANSNKLLPGVALFQGDYDNCHSVKYLSILIKPTFSPLRSSCTRLVVAARFYLVVLIMDGH